MPRKFTPKEEEQIRNKLRAAGRELMGRRGVRKTGVEELANAAGISKGSFYRFFSSKEELALEILTQWERAFHAGIEQRFRSAAPKNAAECARQLTAVLLEDFPRQVAASGIQGLFDPQEVACLIQQAGPEKVKLLDAQDIRLFNSLKPLFADAGLAAGENELTIIAGLRILFEAGNCVLAESAKGSLQPEYYHTAFAKLTEGFVEKMFCPVNSKPETKDNEHE